MSRKWIIKHVLFVSGFFHSAQLFWDSSASYCATIVHPYRRGVHGMNISSPCIFHLLMDIQVASNFCLLHIDLVWTFVYKCARRLSFLINIWEYRGWVLTLSICWILEETLKLFFKRITQVYIPVHAKSLQSCQTLCDPTDYSPPCSSVHGISQARILDWVTMPSSVYSPVSALTEWLTTRAHEYTQCQRSLSFL